MCKACHEQLVDAAIGEGRIPFAKRGTYVRALEQAPRDTAEFLSELQPDPHRARSNRELADPEGAEAERRQVAAIFGIPLEELS